MVVDQLRTARRAAVRHAAAASRAGFNAHEQALTEIVLTRAAPAARIWTFSQREEARTGADWLWWWSSGSEWFGALVQAKRNKPRHGLPWYDFGYRTGAGDRQIDLLLGHARRLGVPAAYVLYNHPRIEPGVTLGSPCCIAPYESWRTRLGVAVVPALLAQPLVGGSEDVAIQHARPLECLVCAGRRPRLLRPVASSVIDPDLRSFLRGGSVTLTRVVALGLLAQLAQMRMGQFRAAPATGVELDAPRQVFRQLPTDRGHFVEPYFEHVLRGLLRQPPWYLNALLEGGTWESVAEELDGVEGVVLFEGA